ncbi:MAG: DUF475 domain-containing protein [Candidatus Pacebacteria bacterium]|nr:DUF475 domain-containing protein [Candidatus Paceibacterota bacterium]
MRKNIKTYFLRPILASVFLFGCTLYGFGLQAFFLVLILSVLEVTLSFDNAVVNARILKNMSPVWQKRFLTWGILLAVFGTRFVLPILIVSVAVWASPLYVTLLSLQQPGEYSALLEGVHGSISAFGGMFLLMVALKYFFDAAKSVHWIRSIERHLVSWGHIEAIEIAIALTALTIVSAFAHYDQASILIAGLVGLILFISMEGIAGSLSIESKDLTSAGFTLFIYLNVLDSAFSLDGVIGAFALTTNLVIIMTGLGIGAYFVRSMTVYLVRENTLAELIYLEHGAHWAIFGLALAMFANLIVHVPEVVTGVIGLCFVLFAYYSSHKERGRLTT